eukprot:5218020-Pleurochrysis_carterae.AAC.1
MGTRPVSGTRGEDGDAAVFKCLDQARMAKSRLCSPVIGTGFLSCMGVYASKNTHAPTAMGTWAFSQLMHAPGRYVRGRTHSLSLTHHMHTDAFRRTCAHA